jgi:peptide/nickel transport system substrate-binding protein
MRRIDSLLILFCSLIFVCGAWAQSGSKPKSSAKSKSTAPVNYYGGDLTYGEGEGASKLNPYTQTAARGTSDRLFALIYEGLVRYDFDKDSIVAVLANSWQQRDAKHLFFYLRRNVSWHDGVPFTAWDVKFTLEFIKLRARPQIANTFAFIDSVSVINDYSIIVAFKRPTPFAIALFDTWIIPRHLFDGHYLDRTDIPSLEIRPIGTGPYKFITKTLVGDISLSFNDKYWAGRGNLESVLMRVIPDPTTLVNSALFESIKMIVETPPHDIGKMEISGKYKLLPYQSFSIHVFAYNCLNPILKSPVFRRALTMAVNREEMLKQWYANKGAVLSGPFTQYSSYFNPRVKPLPYNPEEAGRMLETLGYQDKNGDGIRENSLDGKPLRFQLIIPVERVGGSTVIQNVAQSYVNFLEKIGVRIQITALSLDDYLRVMMDEHKFDIAWRMWTFDNSYDITDLFFTTENYPGGNNFISYSNQEVDKVIRFFQAEEDKERRRVAMQFLHEKLAVECPYTFLYTVDNYAAVHYSYTNVKIDPYYFFTYFPQWYIRPSLRPR